MPKTIVVVDDNEDVLEIVSEMLNRIGIRAMTFSCPEDAMVYLSNPFERRKVTAIISDLMMDKQDGISFLSAVKKDKDLSNIDFYFLTGADIEVFDSLIRPFKIAGVIPKPFYLETFISLLDHKSLIEHRFRAA